MLILPFEKLAVLIELARECDAEVPGAEALAGDAGDGEAAPGERPADAAPSRALGEAISALAADELADLVALAWLGRGHFGVVGWREVRTRATEALRRTDWRYLTGMPPLADDLEEGAATLGLTVGESVVMVH